MRIMIFDMTYFSYIHSQFNSLIFFIWMEFKHPMSCIQYCVIYFFFLDSPCCGKESPHKWEEGAYKMSFPQKLKEWPTHILIIRQLDDMWGYQLTSYLYRIIYCYHVSTTLSPCISHHPVRRMMTNLISVISA